MHMWSIKARKKIELPGDVVIPVADAEIVKEKLK